MNKHTFLALALTVTSTMIGTGCAAPAEGDTDDGADVAAADSDFTAGGGPQFVCGAAPIKDKGNGGPVAVASVRVAANTGFDRMVVEFEATKGNPAYELTPQTNANFTMDMSGEAVKLNGKAGLDFLVRGASSNEYKGQTHFKNAGKAILEAKQTTFFEGDSAWGIGLAKASCYRVFRLSNPPRLVLDVKH